MLIARFGLSNDSWHRSERKVSLMTNSREWFTRWRAPGPSSKNNEQEAGCCFFSSSTHDALFLFIAASDTPYSILSAFANLITGSVERKFSRTWTTSEEVHRRKEKGIGLDLLISWLRIQLVFCHAYRSYDSMNLMHTSLDDVEAIQTPQ
jgi:hypothetical protein